ncbi:facilitated trehalose transporter Tret1-like [Battus philenor]|uniref:facilitated trehalose transporter Tret1-like n=1 Tax=Battus philenor TaxID=42288 RepID=UPI0035CFD1DF
MWCSKDPSFRRQVLVLAGGCCHSISTGIILAYPSVLNAAILSPNATEMKATVEQASWIASATGFAGLLGFFIFCPLFQVIGRKPVNMLFNLTVIIGWIMVYYSKSITMLIIAKVIQGLATGGVFVAAVTINEITHRDKRGVFMTIKKIAMTTGSLLCHSLALIWDWRQIAAISWLACFSALIIVIICPESPAFYAMKGRYVDCEKSFIWFHGDSSSSERELKQLISAQKERISRKQENEKTFKLTKLLKKLLKRDFIIPFLIASLATIAVDTSGRYFLLGYVTQIMVQLIGDKYIAMYCAMMADGLIMIALLISTFVIKTFNRRTILFTFGIASVLLMFVVGLSELVNNSLSTKVKWVTPLVILLHSFVSTVGLIPAAFTITTEIFPLEHRGMGSFTTGITFTLIYGITMKITPTMIRKTGIGGTYSIFGLCVTFCLTVLYFILPETKDKTLQEIEDEIKGVERTDVDVELILLENPKTKT